MAQKDVRLPQEPESEKAILSTALNDPASIPQIAELIEPEDFYSANHQHIWMAAYALLGDGVEVDIAALTAKLRDMGHLKNGLGAYLGKLMDYPVAIDLGHHARLIKQAAARRRAIIEASRLLEEVKNCGNLAEIEKKSADAFSHIQAALSEAQGVQPEPAFKFLHGAELIENLRPISWTIDGVLQTNSFYYTFGDPGSFKSFVEIDRGLCIASGVPFHGHATVQGTVFYVCGEGQYGIGRRMAAWHIAHHTKAADVPFFVSKTPMVLSDQKNVQLVMDAITSMCKIYGPPALVIIDTLARNFGDGDENSTHDMGIVIQNLDRCFGNDFCRGLIHHTGHVNKDRGRGSIALKGGVDAEYRTSLTQNNQILLECTKQKDARKAEPMLFERREIGLLIDNTRDSSLVLDLIAEGADAQPQTAPKLASSQSKALDLLLAMTRKCDHNQGILVAEWRSACIEKKVYTRSDAFSRAVKNMLEKGVVRHGVTCDFVAPVIFSCGDE